ncbi:NUDIX domain-containing protein [Candidatus Woesearchaeota archaeon]|nr:NUDIX domain-containing protein [Candidatus Woesearchaeota archaeon]
MVRTPGMMDLVDEDDNVIGTVGEDEVSLQKRRDRITRAICVLVFDSRGRVLLQRRSARKYRYPLCWDTSVGGMVDSGEGYREAAARETREELGIPVIEEDLAALFRMRFHSDIEEWGAVFLLRHNGPFEPDHDEVEEIRFFTVDEVEALIRSKGDVTPAFSQLFARYLAEHHR